MTDSERLQIAVVGAGAASQELREMAFECGARLARAGAVLLCGGGSGVMSAAASGASSVGGLTVGILPGKDAQSSPPNDAIGLTIFTGMGQARNMVLVLSAGAVLAVGGGWGTLSEIAHALKHGIPVVSLSSWDPVGPSGQRDPLLVTAELPEDAVERVLELARSRQSPSSTAPGVT